jgi:hypothetical protein
MKRQAWWPGHFDVRLDNLIVSPSSLSVTAAHPDGGDQFESRSRGDQSPRRFQTESRERIEAVVPSRRFPPASCTRFDQQDRS